MVGESRNSLPYSAYYGRNRLSQLSLNCTQLHPSYLQLYRLIWEIMVEGLRRRCSSQFRISSSKFGESIVIQFYSIVTHSLTEKRVVLRIEPPPSFHIAKLEFTISRISCNSIIVLHFTSVIVSLITSFFGIQEVIHDDSGRTPCKLLSLTITNFGSEIISRN